MQVGISVPSTSPDPNLHIGSGAETKHARYKMSTRTVVEGPSEELWSLASLVARKTTLRRPVLFGAKEVQVEVFYPKRFLSLLECCCERTRTGTVSSAQRFLLLFNVPQCR